MMERKEEEAPEERNPEFKVPLYWSIIPIVIFVLTWIILWILFFSKSPQGI